MYILKIINDTFVIRLGDQGAINTQFYYGYGPVPAWHTEMSLTLPEL